MFILELLDVICKKQPISVGFKVKEFLKTILQVA